MQTIIVWVLTKRLGVVLKVFLVDTSLNDSSAFILGAKPRLMKAYVFN